VCENRAGKFSGAFQSAPNHARKSLVWALTSNNVGHSRDRMSYVHFASMVSVFLLEQEAVVGRGKGKVVNASANTLPTFVNVTLSAEDKERIRQYVPDPVGLVAWLEEMAGSGYRVGLTWNSEREAYICSVTARDTGTANDGKCVTSFAGGVLQAVFVAWFKHVHVLDDVWESPSSAGSGEWG